MVDEKVLEVQQWLNETDTAQNSYTPIEENGKSRNVTVSALITALQIELGIASPTRAISFGSCPSTDSRKIWRIIW